MGEDVYTVCSHITWMVETKVLKGDVFISYRLCSLSDFFDTLHLVQINFAVTAHERAKPKVGSAIIC